MGSPISMESFLAAEMQAFAEIKINGQVIAVLPLNPCVGPVNVKKDKVTGLEIPGTESGGNCQLSSKPQTGHCMIPGLGNGQAAPFWADVKFSLVGTSPIAHAKERARNQAALEAAQAAASKV